MRGDRILARGRRLAAELMPAECVIRRTTGETVLNEVTLETEPVSTVIYEGPCDPEFDSSVLREVEAVGRALTEQQPILKLPVVGSEDVRVNDVAEITAHRHDARMVGLKARIAGAHGGSVTARRLPVEVTSG